MKKQNKQTKDHQSDTEKFIGVRVPWEHYLILQSEAKARGLSLSQFLRIVIDHTLNKITEGQPVENPREKLLKELAS